MLKKRILASSMASVMALSAVSVVAFADETATDFGEVVTKAELKEHLKTYESLIKGEINNYGSVQALRFQEAYDHATYVAADANADDASVIAAYQMVKAVYETLEQYDNEDLKELIAENKPTYDGNNILNEEIMDNIYDEDAYIAFKNAYEEAESTVDVDDLMMTTDAYINLAEAAKTLEGKKLTPVTKTEYRALFREYENMLSQFSKYETWRRGTVTVNPVTGKDSDNDAKNNDLTKAAYVTWGDLQTIVTGASNVPVVATVKEIDRDASKPGTDTLMTRAGTWVAPGSEGTVEATFYAQSKAFDEYKSAVKTTDPTIKGAYNAAKEAIAVFKSWKAIDADSTQKSASVTTLNSYRTKLVNDFESALAATLESDAVTGLFWEDEGGTKHKALKYDEGKLVGQADAAKNGCYLRIDSGTGLIQLAEVVGHEDYATAAYVPTEITNRKSYTIKISEGVDYLKYIPVRAENVKVNTVLTSDVSNKIAHVNEALTMLETYTVVANKGTNATATDKENAYGEQGSAKDVADLDENTTVTKPALSAKEYTFINRYLTYSLSDLYPVVKAACSHTRSEVKALIVKAYDLIDETGSCNIFAKANAELANARKEAVEWVRESEKDKLYKDNDGDHGKFYLASASGDVDATYVYHTLSCKGTTTADANDTYDKLQDLLKKYPISYGEIVEKIADVNEKVEDGIYGELVKAAADDVAYCMSVLKASEEGNEAYTDERALNSYNRLRSDGKGDDTEKALVKALAALDTAIEDAEKEPEVVKGDLDGDGKPSPADARAALELYLAGEYNEAADMDGNGIVNAKDARAILELWLQA